MRVVDRRWPWFVLAAVILASPASGQQNGSIDKKVLSPDARRIINNFAHEHATCVAYYVIANKCFGSGGGSSTSTKLQAAGSEMIVRGRRFTEIAGLKPETFDSRIELETQLMVRALGSDCANISIALNKHALVCKDVVEFPEKRIEAISKEVDRAGNSAR